MSEPLSVLEDEELRRLAALAQFGQLTPQSRAVYDELRSRDRRTEVRPPRAVAIPLQARPRDEESLLTP